MSLILRCPVCEKHYEANDEIVRQPSIQCPLCNTEAAASDFSAMMFCPHCRGKLAVSLDMLNEVNLSCPRCEKTFVPTINISLDDDDDEDMDLFADENEGKSSFNEGDFFDKYKIIRLLGRGGMGEVYLAEHLFLHREVALKIMLSDVAKNSVFAKRFVREAKIANKIESPNLIGVFDVGIENQTEMLFIAMEYVNGKNVSELIKENGVFDEQTTLNIAYHVVNALEAMEKENVVHRDIKPSNIMIDFEGNIKLADLGIAKSNNHAEGDLTLTQDSVVFGTPNYASPEQCRSSHNVDSRSDIYSLGATMYQMVTGEAPYTGETGMEIMLKVLGDATPDFDKLKGMSAGFTALLYDMMQKDPEKRPQNIAELKERLEKLLEGENIWQYKIRIMLKKALPLAKNIGVAILKSPLLLFKKRKKIDSALKHFCNFISFCILLALLGVLAYHNQDKLGDLWMKYIERIDSESVVSDEQLRRLNKRLTRGSFRQYSSNRTDYGRKQIFPIKQSGTAIKPAEKTTAPIAKKAGTEIKKNKIQNASYAVDLTKIAEDKKKGFTFSEDNMILLRVPHNISGSYEIPQGVKVIAGRTFANCYNLKNIIIPDSVVTINDLAFSGCYNLHNIIIPDSVRNLGHGVFSSCRNLQSITIPAHIKFIDSDTFFYCKNLQKITAPAGLKIIGDAAQTLQNKVISSSPAITEKDISSRDLKKIEEDKKKGFTFSEDNTILEKAPRNLNGTYEIPNGIKIIGQNAFLNSMFHEIVIPDSVRFIGSYAFSRCFNLKKVKLSNNITNINYGVFSDCENLQHITIPDSVLNIGNRVFGDCKNLQSVILPANLIIIDSGVFNNCGKLEKIVTSANLKITGKDEELLKKKIISKETYAAEKKNPKTNAVNYDALAESSKLAVNEQKSPVTARRVVRNYPKTIKGRLDRCNDIIAELKDGIAKNPDNKWLKERLDFMTNTVRKNLLRQYNNLKTAEERKQRGAYDERANNEIKALFCSIAEKRKNYGYGKITDKQGLEDLNRLFYLMNSRNFDPNITVEDPGLNSNARQWSLLKHLLNPRFIPNEMADRMLDILFRKYVMVTDINYPFMLTNKKLLNYGINDLDGVWYRILRDERDLIPVFTELGADVNYKYQGASILHWAVSITNYSTVKKMLLAGGDVAALDQNGQTPLFWAEKYAYDSVVKLLTSVGSDPEYCDNSGKKASDYKYYGEFNYALKRNNFNKISAMLDKYPNLANERVYDGLSPLQYAVSKYNVPLVKKLLDMKVNIFSYSPVKDSPTGDLVHKIINGRENYDDRSKMLQIYKMLLAAGQPIPSNSYHYFSYSPYRKIDKLMTNCLIEIARYTKKEEDAVRIFNVLYNRNNNYNNEIERSRYSIIYALLEYKKFRLNQPAFKYVFANAAANPKVSEHELLLLLEHKADINEKNPNGQTALFQLCEESQRYAIKNIRYVNNMPTLNDYIRRIKFLLTKHAKLDIECNGRTVADLNLPQDVIKSVYQIRRFLKDKKRR